ncbi:hypothetical protein EJB05_31229, partial [Eragrostis curvula]
MGHPFPPPGWWPGLPPPPIPPGFGGFGASWGAQPQSQGAINLEAPECDVNYSPPGGLLSYLQSGNASFPAPVSDSSSQHAAPAKKANMPMVVGRPSVCHTLQLRTNVCIGNS